MSLAKFQTQVHWLCVVAHCFCHIWCSVAHLDTLLQRRFCRPSIRRWRRAAEIKATVTRRDVHGYWNIADRDDWHLTATTFQSTQSTADWRDGNIKVACSRVQASSSDVSKMTNDRPTCLHGCNNFCSSGHLRQTSDIERTKCADHSTAEWNPSAKKFHNPTKVCHLIYFCNRIIAGIKLNK